MIGIQFRKGPPRQEYESCQAVSPTSRWLAVYIWLPEALVAAVYYKESVNAGRRLRSSVCWGWRSVSHGTRLDFGLVVGSSDAEPLWSGARLGCPSKNGFSVRPRRGYLQRRRSRVSESKMWRKLSYLGLDALAGGLPTLRGSFSGRGSSLAPSHSARLSAPREPAVLGIR